MELEEINDWEEINLFLEEKGFFHDEKNCDGSLYSHNCEHCNYYFELVTHQQNLAKSKYQNLTPIETWNKSFIEMKSSLKNKLK